MPEEIMLNYLGSGYFHEDFDLDAASPRALVQKFAMNDYRGYVEIIVAELSGILAEGITESQARTMWLDDANAYYEPTVDGKSYLEWMHEILEVAQEALRVRSDDD